MGVDFVSHCLISIQFFEFVGKLMHTKVFWKGRKEVSWCRFPATIITSWQSTDLWERLIQQNLPKLLDELSASPVAPALSPASSFVVGLRVLIFDALGSFGPEVFQRLTVRIMSCGRRWSHLSQKPTQFLCITMTLGGVESSNVFEKAAAVRSFFAPCAVIGLSNTGAWASSSRTLPCSTTARLCSTARRHLWTQWHMRT